VIKNHLDISAENYYTVVKWDVFINLEFTRNMKVERIQINISRPL